MVNISLNPTIAAVTARIIERSKPSRQAYLARIEKARDQGTNRPQLSCGNLAHGFAGAGGDASTIRGGKSANIGIVTAYNDMLSAHQPYSRYPEVLKVAAREAGATAQVAGGVPAMCDGVTQGQAGMELSLFSRDVIAQSTAIALSHAMFEGALLLGICDKIVPGLLIGALSFGHLPTIFVPAGPMPSGLSNKEKARVRQLYAEGKASREDLLEAEAKSYHSPGTCTFYGTANSNQMMMEVMGLHLPGAAFVNPGTPLRDKLTRAAAQRVTQMTWLGENYRPLAHTVDEKAIVNAAVGLLATGGSTNHAIHIPAMARAAGIVIDWDDLSALSGAVPLVTQIYPNGTADINHFQAAGGMAFVIRELLSAGFLHSDIATVSGQDLWAYARDPKTTDEGLEWVDAPAHSLDTDVVRPVSDPFRPDGGMRLVQGNLGRAIFKTSAVDPSRWIIEAPARVFQSQEDVQAAFKAGELDRDVVVVVRFQGPCANGMPELHKLTPLLGVLQDRGYKVALVTDGRMSGASGKVPAAIHVSPEALGGGPLAKIQDNDMICLNAHTGQLEALVEEAIWQRRQPDMNAPTAGHHGTGRELFGMFRHLAGTAETGASAMLDFAGEA